MKLSTTGRILIISNVSTEVSLQVQAVDSYLTAVWFKAGFNSLVEVLVLLLAQAL